MSISYLQPDALVELLKDPHRQCSVVVLDVRDDDFEGGHVRGCINIPAYDFRGEAIDRFIENHLCDCVEMCVVHCYLSQQRGPLCARRLAERLLQLERGGKPQVRVLAHGWRRFGILYGDDAQVCCMQD